MKTLSLLLFASFLAFSCQKDDTSNTLDNSSLVGTWLLYETAYSIGGPLIVQKVPTTPPQTITFTTNGEVLQQKAENAPIEKSLYRIDSTAQGLQIAFFEKPGDPLTFSHLKVTNTTLVISPPCIEGCYSAYKKHSSN